MFIYISYNGFYKCDTGDNFTELKYVHTFIYIDVKSELKAII